MPELPEAETIARKLSEKISGKTLKHILLRRTDILKSGTPADFQTLHGKKIQKVGRRAKCIVLFFENGCQLWVHLGMTGQLMMAAKPAGTHHHAEFTFGEMPATLIFRDIRRFGGLSFYGPGLLPSSLGPEPLEMSPEDFKTRLRSKKGRIKALLMDQKFVAGIGNIYADEILFRAKIHPKKTPSKIPAGKVLNLFQTIQKVLQEAIADGGSSIDDYVHPDGRRGKFQEKHRVYAKAGKPCPDCASEIRRIVLNGRSTCFCPVCQK